MQYTKIENVLDTHLLEYMHNKYCNVTATDHVSNKFFYPSATLDGTLPEWHIQPMAQSDKMAVLASLQDGRRFKGFKHFHRANINVHKMNAGTSIATHIDPCVLSITVCLTGDYVGGEFNELDQQGNVLNSMWLGNNSACVYYSPHTHSSPPHSVNTITEGNRITLQIFVPGDQHKTIDL